MQKIEFYFDKFLSQKIEKEIKYLFIGYLTYLEELLNSGKISENEYNKKRKEILDNGNGAIRNIQEQISSVFENIKIVN
jgi:hypothetical protein